MVSSSSNRRLLVEGHEDKHAIIHLLKGRGANWDKPDKGLPYIEVLGGFQQLRKGLDETLFKSLETVGVVVDANSSPKGRWESLQDRLGESGVTIPDMPILGGWIGESTQFPCRCGIWMMPDNRAPGMLEDFLALLVPPHDTVWPHAQAATEDAKRLGAPFSDVVRSKAVIHSWLAWQEEPGRSFGQAITKKVLGTDNPTADAFVIWFNRLFS